MIDRRGSYQPRKGMVPIYWTNPRAIHVHADGCCRSSTMRPLIHRLPSTLHTTSRTALPEDEIGRLARPVIGRRSPAEGEKSQWSPTTGMTCDATWMIEQVAQDPSTDLEGIPLVEGTSTGPGSIEPTEFGTRTGPEQTSTTSAI